MPLISAAIVPHPPVLVPGVGRANRDRLKLTIKAMDKLAAEIKDKAIDAILLISPHGPVMSGAFAININTEYKLNLEEFGDFGTKKTWTGLTRLAHDLKAGIGEKIPVRLYTEDDLDHGAGVPLYALTEKLAGVRVVPVNYSELDRRTHYRLGRLFSPTLDGSEARIMAIASGDLSHTLTQEAPAGYNPRGAKFDARLIELLKQKKPQDILKLEPKLVEEAEECGLRSILILLGILDKRKYAPQVLSYEFPFGVGYLTMRFELK